jgi:hypothetical protein
MEGNTSFLKVCLFLLLSTGIISPYFGLLPGTARAAPGYDQDNGAYADDFADGSGILSGAGAYVNTLTGNIQLTNSSGRFSAPYTASGYVITRAVRPLEAAEWGSLDISAATPPGTSLQVQVLDGGNYLYADAYLPGNSTGISSFPVNLSTVPVLSLGLGDLGCENEKSQTIRLKLILTTTDPSATPEVDSLRLNWTVRKPVTSSTSLARGPWPMDGIDREQTFHLPYRNKHIYPAFRWVSSKFEKDSCAGMFYVLKDRLLGYSVGWGNYFFSLNRDSGDLNWRMPFYCGNMPYGFISREGIFFGTDIANDLFYAIDTNQGQVTWSYNFFGGHGNSQAAQGRDGTLFTLRAQNGDKSGTLYAFNQDGTVMWSKDFSLTDDQQAFSCISVGSDGTLYFSNLTFDEAYNPTPNAKLRAVDGTDGSIKWEYPIGTGNCWGPVIIGPDGVIYVGTGDWTRTFEIKLYAIHTDGTLKWEKSFGAGDTGFYSLSLRSDGNLWANYVTQADNCGGDDFSKILEISGTDGSILWKGPNVTIIYQGYSDGANGFFYADINRKDLHAQVAKLVYYDGKHNLKWQIPYTWDSVSGNNNLCYAFNVPVMDERGWIYAGFGKGLFDQNWYDFGSDQEYMQAFALSPWTASVSTNSGRYSDSTRLGNANCYDVGDTINFSVTTSMLKDNPLFGGGNKVQVVLDNGDKIPLSYQRRNHHGDTVWTGTYQILPSVSGGWHSYIVELSAASIQTDIPTHFDSPAPQSNNTGIIKTGNFKITDAEQRHRYR